VVHDAGAYCMSMASTYNLKMRPPEYWVWIFLSSFANVFRQASLVQESGSERKKTKLILKIINEIK
jgi:hypothetical protein